MLFVLVHQLSYLLSLKHRMSAYPKSHNPFADDDDEEDSGRAAPRRGFNFDDDPEESSLSPAERRQRQLQQEVTRTAQSAVDSSHRSLGLIYESEKVGAETAEVRRTSQRLNFSVFCLLYTAHTKFHLI